MWASIIFAAMHEVMAKIIMKAKSSIYQYVYMYVCNSIWICPSVDIPAYFACHSNILLQTEQEIAEVETEIKGLEQSLADKVPPMMVAHTRLENRTVRPNMELCRDTPQYGIVGEVADIAESQMALREKLDVAR